MFQEIVFRFMQWVQAEPSARSTRQDLVALTVLAAAVLLPFLGQNGNWASREIRHAEIMREMAETGDFLVPHLLGRQYVDKPPIMHVVGAGLMRLTGSSNLFLARFPSALAAIIGVLAVYGLGRLLLNRQAAWLGAVCLLGFPGFIITARLARPDMVFGVLMLLSALGLAWSMGSGSPARRNLALALAGVASGLAIITKGPYGLIFPLLTVLFAPLQNRQLRRPRWELAVFGGATLATIAAWGIPAYLHDQGRYLYDVLHQPDLTSGASTHTEAFYWYVGPVILLTLPMGLALPCAVQKWRRQGVSAALAIAGAILLVLSCVPGKRNHYLTPMYPFLALALAEGVLACRWRPRLMRRGFGISIALVTVGSLIYLGLVLPWMRPEGDPNYEFTVEAARLIPPGAAVVCLESGDEAMAWIRRSTRGIRSAPKALAAAAALKECGRGAYLVAREPVRAELAQDEGLLPLRQVLQMPGERKGNWYLFRYGE